MAVNRVPVLKRCRSLGLEPTYLGIDKKSTRELKRSSRCSSFVLTMSSSDLASQEQDARLVRLSITSLSLSTARESTSRPMKSRPAIRSRSRRARSLLRDSRLRTASLLQQADVLFRNGLRLMLRSLKVQSRKFRQEQLSMFRLTKCRSSSSIPSNSRSGLFGSLPSIHFTNVKEGLRCLILTNRRSQSKSLLKAFSMSSARSRVSRRMCPISS